MKRLLLLAAMLLMMGSGISAGEREAIWPEGKMPDLQQKQCVPYIEWHIPTEIKTKAIQIVYSGGHLTLMGVTSSKHQSYLPIDTIDRLPCNVQWGVGIYPAYVLTDGINGKNTNNGNDGHPVRNPYTCRKIPLFPKECIPGNRKLHSP